MRILLCGASGAIGREIASLADPDSGISISATANRTAFFPAKSDGDVLIDFSHPDLTERCLTRAVELNIPAVIGTTGLTPSCQERLEAASAHIPICQAANFSIGVNLMLSLVAHAARGLPEAFDIEISEMHHRRKLDAPSGTAIALGQAVSEARGNPRSATNVLDRSQRRQARPLGEIGFQVARGGDVAGEHTVYFLGNGERLEISHRATNRSIFARGALLAAKKLLGRDAGRVEFGSLLLDE